MKVQSSIARVVLETRLPQLDRLFDYAIPQGLALEPGVRVKVPLRSSARYTTGFVVEVGQGSEHTGSLAEIAEVISDVVVLTPEVWALSRAVATRQAGNAADVLRLAVPPRYVRAEKKWRESHEVHAPPPAESGTYEEFTDEALGVVASAGQRTVLSLPSGLGVTPQGVTTTRGAIIVAELAARALRAGGSAIVVVPDWRDRESFFSALAAVIPPESLVLWRADQPGSERYAEFLRVLTKAPMVVVGNRHAVYAPVSQLGALIVVDDADDSHREPLAPYPHTRDIALLRHQHTNCALVLASLVPSMSAARWLSMGFFTALEPRVSRRPQVTPTALSMTGDHDLSPARIPSIAHQGALQALREGPILVQVFRAGFSSALACKNCGERGECARCSGPLRLSALNQPPSCAWCAQVHARWRCAQCALSELVPRGRGIGRTVADLGRAFPRVPVIQSDGENKISSVPGTPAVVVATRGAEPTAPGGYRAALLLDGQSMLSRESLGALEDTLRFWEHAISLVCPTGHVYVTEVDGPPALAVASGRYAQLVSQELREREALRLPPTIRMCSVTGPSVAVGDIVERVVKDAVGVDVLGPVTWAEGGVRVILRFPYAQGENVVRNLRSAHLRYITSRARGASDRVRIVVDDAGQFDSLFAE